MTSGLPIKGAVALVLYAGFLRQGYRRRRGVWTPRSWRRFALLLTLSFAVLALGFRMAVGVDNGVYEGMSSTSRTAYFAGLMVSIVVGVAGAAGLILWFALGRSDRQLG